MNYVTIMDSNLCRYSTFLILYPTGITSEVGLIYIALPYIKVLMSYDVGIFFVE